MRCAGSCGWEMPVPGSPAALWQPRFEGLEFLTGFKMLVFLFFLESLKIQPANFLRPSTNLTTMAHACSQENSAEDLCLPTCWILFWLSRCTSTGKEQCFPMALEGVGKALGVNLALQRADGLKNIFARAFCPKLTHFGTGSLHYLACCLSSKTFPGAGWTWWGSSECNKLMSWSRCSCWYFQTGMTGDVIHLGAPGELKRWNVPINI